ncbi:succinate-acetate transporter protein [Clostridium beijerinckii]|nr:succinate-acetate transporter protein [Clostridium beijerinckii]
MLIKFNAVTNGISLDTRMDGWAWLVLSISLIMWTPAFLKTPLVLSLIILALDLSSLCISLIDLGVLPKIFSNIPAFGLLIAGILGIYLAAAIIVNTAFGRQIYPSPGPIIK